MAKPGEPPRSVVLFRDQGDEISSTITLAASAEKVTLTTRDIGPKVATFWGGDGDYEFWLGVPAAAFTDLLFALLKEKYGGDERAVEHFREFCEAHNVQHQFDNWVWR